MSGSDEEGNIASQQENEQKLTSALKDRICFLKNRQMGLDKLEY